MNKIENLRKRIITGNPPRLILGIVFLILGLLAVFVAPMLHAHNSPKLSLPGIALLVCAMGLLSMFIAITINDGRLSKALKQERAQLVKPADFNDVVFSLQSKVDGYKRPSILGYLLGVMFTTALILVYLGVL